MKIYPSTIRRALPAQDIYFDIASAPRQSWCMTVFCTTLLLTTLLACFLPATLPIRTASAASAGLAPFIARTHLPLAREKQVFHQGWSQYHWHFQCPLANHRSLRSISADATPKRIYLTQQEAQRQKLTPCYYCLELEK